MQGGGLPHPAKEKTMGQIIELSFIAIGCGLFLAMIIKSYTG